MNIQACLNQGSLSRDFPGVSSFPSVQRCRLYLSKDKVLRYILLKISYHVLLSVLFPTVSFLHGAADCFKNSP